ncbi:ferritin-like domain-containing protein [Mucilaginibacter sp. Bleaf8]|uniref:ferritin-like domain-containing protein n=1 Tax=Mucilaginibacter sp. Bleaf8 TaxID=2834430 RepID=UPI001BCBD789|nr:ferritin-like domain-containing protein [Mucilaginibacter sp. Bleaf8]MBS7563433.1 ferritin-like domain-containing protein [Mucilaginibacter sp. Bleaf8]
MNLLNLFDEINQADPEFADRISPRRDAIKNITSFGSKVAVAAMPFVFSTLVKKAYGQALSPQVIEVLNFALTAEYLESTYYNTYGQRSNIPSGDRPGIELIRVDENNHKKFLLQNLGSAAISEPKFDYTAGGTFADLTRNDSVGYDTFLALAQAFEDNGVRAYKGQAPALMSAPAILTAALNIHSVEGRHAAHLRYLRQRRGVAVKPWITGVTSGIPAAPVALVYAGEDNVTQGGVNLTTLPGASGNATANMVTEAYDEPNTKENVTNIVKLFLAK